MKQADVVLEYWFGTEVDDARTARQCEELWWKKNPAIDDEIRSRFSSLLDESTTGNLDFLLTEPRGRLAMIIMADQFSRNMYRGTARSFAFDTYSQRWCKDGLAIGADRQLRPIERVFFNMPLEHSESLEDQQRSVALAGELVESVPHEQRKLFQGYLDYAKRHLDIVQRFGRFPHRNAILGRQSTEEEIAFLRKPGSSF